MKSLTVMGMGYIGLPTAVMFAKHGLNVHGVDVNPLVVEGLNNHNLHIEEPGLKEYLTEVMNDEKLTISQTPKHSDVFIIAVPTPINEDKTAKLDYVQKATEMIAPYLKKGNLVVLESTVPPKTVEDIMIPVLEKTELIIGKEVFISHSPERVLPGKLFEELVSNDRIVGGINEESSQKTVDLYKTFVKGTIHITNTTTAEMVKLLENTYRDVNIAFANEVARIGEKLGFNAWEAIELANYHPRVNIHTPGPGVGGHCIAVDPYFIIEQVSNESNLISLSRKINEETPMHLVNMITKLVKDVENPTISICGLAFKGNIDDMRESPSLIVINELIKKNYTVKVYDPYVKKEAYNKVSTIEEASLDSDLLVFLTDHSVFKEISPSLIKGNMNTARVIDAKNILDKKNWESKGFNFNLIGDSNMEIKFESETHGLAKIK